MLPLSTEEINRRNIIDYLDATGHQPQKITGYTYWYQTPFPLLVNKQLNRWKEANDATWYTLSDLCIRTHQGTIGELITLLTVPHKPSRSDTTAEPELGILDLHPIRSFYLLQFLWEHRISLVVAQQYCVEAHYTHQGRPYYAIGFRNDAGGYQLRSRTHRYHTSPQSNTFITHHSKDLILFNDFFDLLTFATFINISNNELPDFLVLQSIDLFKEALPVIDAYPRKHLFLQNNPTGDQLTRITRQRGNSYINHRSLYKGYTGLNQWVCNIGKAIIPYPPHPPDKRP